MRQKSIPRIPFITLVIGFLPDGSVSFDCQSNWDVDTAAEDHVVHWIEEVDEQIGVEAAETERPPEGLKDAEDDEEAVKEGQGGQHLGKDAPQVFAEKCKWM